MIISDTDKLKCAKRELGYRRYVYPKRVGDGSMTEDQAKREIAIMEAIVADYEKAAEKERLL